MTASRLLSGLRHPTAVRAVKLALTVLVLAALVRHVIRTWRDLDAHNLSITLDPSSLVVAAGLYLAGLWAQGTFFGLVLASGPTPITAYAATRAYLISHLAKYVPGKAMVVVVRSALCAGAGARPATAAFATLYETLVMMATGGLVAAAGFGVLPDLRSIEVAYDGPGRFQFDLVRSARWMTLPSLICGLGLLALVLPATFPKLAGLIRRPLRDVGADTVPRLSAGLLIRGFFWSAVGWILLGASLMFVILGIELTTARERTFYPWDGVLVVACMALATVAGFVVPIAPGGLGVREWVLWTTLGAIMPHDRAVVAATLLRLVWVAAEVVAAGILLPIRPPRVRARPEPGAAA